MLSFKSRLGPFEKLCSFAFIIAFCAICLSSPALGQSAPGGDAARINPSALPTDQTPLIFSGERGLLSRELKFSLLKKLPERLWFSTYTEVSQRLETNPRFTRRDAKPDYVFRALPNVTVGYDFLKNTGVYCNYFVIKDVFARTVGPTGSTLQSVSLGLRHTHALNKTTSLQFDFQSRELWQAAGFRQADLLPSVSITKVVTPNLIVFGNLLLQLRGRNYFVAPTREIDPFYSAGVIFRKGKWNFIVSDTLVTNFRHPPFANPVPRQGNVSMISDFEINHPISNRYLPGALAFVRAEPVWNWRSNGVPGLSGFDFRLFTGVRIALSKPAYSSTIDKMRQQIIDYDNKLGAPANSPGKFPSQSQIPPSDPPQITGSQTPTAKDMPTENLPRIPSHG